MSFTIFLMLGFYGGFIEGRNFTEYKLQPQITGHACKRSDAVGAIMAQSYLACAYLCFKHPGCVSFFYSNMTMVCDRCNTTYDVMDVVNLDGEGRNMYYSIKVGEIGEVTTTVEDTTSAGDTTVVEETTAIEYTKTAEGTTTFEDTKTAEDSTVVDNERFEYTACYSVDCSHEPEGYSLCEAVYEELNMNAITVDKCYEICKSFAMFFSISMADCYCDMSYLYSGTCTTPCVGDPDQTCGGPASASFYRIKSRDQRSSYRLRSYNNGEKRRLSNE